MSLPAAIVLCCSKAGLALIRALARKNIPIVGLCYGEYQIGAVSRHLIERHWCPDPSHDEGGFIRFLLSLAGRWPSSVLFPIGDGSLVAVSRNRDQLLPHFRIVAEDWGIVRQVIEKRLTYDLAHQHGIPCPRIHVARDAEDALAFAAEIGFPCLLKPSVGHVFFDRYQAKMLMIHNADRLREIIENLTDYDAELMVSEFIPGNDMCGVNYNSYYVDGVPVAEFTAQKIRLRPTMIGFPTAIVSKRLPEVVELGRRMIGFLGYNGFSCIEFKKDIRDNSYKLMEVNGRHNFSGLLAVECGLNFPYFSYLDALGEKFPVEQHEQTEGIYWLDEHMDIRGLFSALNKGGNQLRGYAQPYLRKHVSAVLSLSDPWPSVYNLTEALRKLASRGRKGSGGLLHNRPTSNTAGSMN